MNLDARSAVYVILIFWATTGLTLLHVAVLGVRHVSRKLGKKRERDLLVRVAHEDWQRPTLTFLVPVYNEALTLGSTLDSLLRQTVRPDHIIVIDDGSTDKTAEVASSYSAQGVQVVRMKANGGKTRALEAGLARVSTELVAVTDADSVVDARYVELITRDFRDDPELAACGGAVESIPHTWVTASRQIDYMMTVRIDRDAEASMNALIVLPGVSSTFRTKILREMGFEHDTIAEDFDVTFRLQRAGRKIKMNMEAKVYTSDPPTLRSYYRQLVRWYTDFWLVIRKHRAVLGKRVFGTVEVPLVVLNATVSTALYLVFPIWMLVYARERLPLYFATTFGLDVLLVTVAWRVYRRTDVWWAVLSRTPTRALGRLAYAIAMARVLIGRPGLAWTKLDRRSNADFMASGAQHGDDLARLPASSGIQQP